MIEGRTVFGFKHMSMESELYVVRESKKTKLLGGVAGVRCGIRHNSCFDPVS